MGYLKDVVLPRALDDATFATLSSLMLFNNMEVLMALHQDRDFFPELFRCGGGGGVGACSSGGAACCCSAGRRPRLGMGERLLGALLSRRVPRPADYSPLCVHVAPHRCRRLKAAAPDSQEWRDLVAFLQARRLPG